MLTTAQHHATPPPRDYYAPGDGMQTRIDINGWRETIARACDDLYVANHGYDLTAATTIIEKFVVETP